MKLITVLFSVLVLAAISQAISVTQIMVGARFETAAESRGANLVALSTADWFRDTVKTVAEPNKGPIARLYVDAFNPLLIGSRHSRMSVSVHGLADAPGGLMKIEAKTRDGWRMLVEFDFQRERSYGITVGIAQRYLDYGTTKLRITMRSTQPVLFRIDQVQIRFID